jgi:hypothetical protein
MGYGIGNGGNNFIAANVFSANKVQPFVNKYLSSISMFINQTEDLAIYPINFKLAVFYGDTRVVNQTVNAFTPNTWNTVVLNTPLLLNEAKELKIGVEITAHNAAEYPVAVDFVSMANTELGGNVVSEDGGVTWQSIESMIEDGMGNLAIIGNVVNSSTNVITDRDDVIGYLVYRNDQRTGALPIPTATYVDNVTASSVTYKVSTYYKTGLESPVSAPFELTPTGINLTPSDLFNIFPNPVSDYVQIVGNFTKATIFDINGKQMLEATTNRISVSNLPNGIYLLKIESGNQITTSKLIKK